MKISENSSSIVQDKKILLSVPFLSGKEWDYVKECFDSGWVSTVGPAISRFEEAISDYTGAQHAVACSSGTAALHLALILAEVQPGDEVIVPTITFVAPINAVRYVQADPIFMDSDEFYNMDEEKTIQFLRDETSFKNGVTVNKKTGKIIRALIVVHVFGNAARLDRLAPFCKERNIKLIEDAAESLGTRYKEGVFARRHTGTIAEISCLSFNGNKIMTTGGGGMLLTSNPVLAEKAKYLSTQAKDDGLNYIHHEVGYNYRLSNVLAALGLAQLENMEIALAAKKRNFEQYRQIVKSIPGLRLADPPAYAENNLWMYALQVDPKVFGRSRHDLISLLAEKGIETRPVWELNHRQKPFQQFQNYRVDNAKKLWENTINIPCSVGLQTSDVQYVGGILADLCHPQ